MVSKHEKATEFNNWHNFRIPHREDVHACGYSDWLLATWLQRSTMHIINVTQSINIF